MSRSKMENSPEYQEVVIAAWLSDIEQIAWKFVGRNGAELDDLVQEGMIAVWRNLEAQRSPSKTAIKNRMIDYTRFLSKNSHRPYELVVDAPVSL